MKMTKHQFKNLVDAVRPLDTETARANYRNSTRYRWDIFFAAGGTKLLTLPGMEGSGDVSARCGDLSDSHIETALRRIIPELK